MTPSPDKAPPTMEELHLNPLSPDTAPGLVELFRALYGECYPEREVYQPEQLLSLHTNGERATWVAHTSEGKVVGSITISRQTPYARLYTLGHAVVLPDYRGRSLALQLTMLGATEVFQDEDVAGGLTETGCHALKTQELVYKGSFLPCAMLPGALPPEALPVEQRVEQPVSLLVSFIKLQDAPQTAFVPARAALLVSEVVRILGVQRELREAPMGAPEPTSQVTVSQHGDLTRLSVARIGADLIQLLPREAPRSQVVLPLDTPAVSFAEELLYRFGYRPCGLFPRWFGGDGLVYQKVNGPVSFEQDVLYAPESQQLAALVYEQWAS